MAGHLAWLAVLFLLNFRKVEKMQIQHFVLWPAIYLTLPSQSIPCHARQVMPYKMPCLPGHTMPCLPGHTIYPAMPSRPYHAMPSRPYHVMPTRPYHAMSQGSSRPRSRNSSLRVRKVMLPGAQGLRYRSPLSPNAKKKYFWHKKI